MNGLTKKSLVVALGVGAALIAGAAFAGGDPPVCPAGGTCPQGPLCHNIGGPEDKGANCEATALCEAFFDEETGFGIVLRGDQYLGIVIGAGENSWESHLNHGDGFATTVFPEALHLASVIGPHKASNVECIATRATTTQPDEPGN